MRAIPSPAGTQTIMSGNSFGRIFRITTFGESHGPAIGVVIDGCPPGLKISIQDIQEELNLRRPGQSSITTSRQEKDEVQILSGIYSGRSLGTPIGLLIANRDARPEDYKAIEEAYRPGHADYTYEARYGIRDPRGGGRASARETAARVAAGAIARKILHKESIEVAAWVSQVHELMAPEPGNAREWAQRWNNPVRCPDPKTAQKMTKLIEQARAEGDSLGGCISGRVYARDPKKGLPAGLGSPVFDKLQAVLGHALLSINAVKGIEFGSGFSSTQLKGSQNNDAFTSEEGRIRTQTNHSGGIQGGISNGEDITFRLAFKPTSTIMKTQQTVNKKGQTTQIQMQGRHDPCVLPRAVPIVEAMAALVLADELLLYKTLK